MDKHTKKAAGELLTIYEISKVLSSSLDLHKTLRGVLNLLADHVHARRTMASLCQGTDWLEVVAATGMSPEEVRRGRFRMGEGIIGRVLKTAVPAVIPDIACEPLVLNRMGELDQLGDRVVSFVAVPIKTGREVVGVLSIDLEGHPPAQGFASHVQFLSLVANLIGQTVRLHRRVAEEREQLMQETHRLQKELKGRYSLDNVVGSSKAMQEVFADVHQCAGGRSTILLRGESGTGKEVIARAIHYRSPRAERPFIKLNCAALPETLLESELFGHEKGAFTGATQERKGRFEMANGGTLFLDEIGDITPAFQAKLLRVLQEREFERVGGTRTIRVDVRLICATNRNLEEAVTDGSFRADLYFRINVVSVFLPPLRERREDIPPLADYFLAKYNRENGRSLSLSPDASQVLMGCSWPGNVRELENCIERTATMTRGNLIRDVDLRCQKGQCFSSVLNDYNVTRRCTPHIRQVSEPPSPTIPAAPADDLNAPAEPATERERLIWAMEKCGWVQAKAARLLELTPRQMGYALKKYHIEIKHL